MGPAYHKGVPCPWGVPENPIELSFVRFREWVHLADAEGTELATHLLTPRPLAADRTFFPSPKNNGVFFDVFFDYYSYRILKGGGVQGEGVTGEP